MRRTDQFLSWMSAALAGLAVLLSPWLFGAWEMWWFWPFAVTVFAATLCFGLRLVLGSPGPRPSLTDPRSLAALSFIPFLIYALVRACQADVAMDAERSFLLFLTPFLLGLVIAFGFSSRQRRSLWRLVALNLGLLGLYGIVNYYVTENRLVLWAPGFAKYQSDAQRATGSYFCPDHFAGIMEVAFCLGLAIAFSRGLTRTSRAGGALLAAIGTAGVILSKSRGGGLTLIVILAATLVWGMLQWPRSIRWYWRLSGASLTSLALIVFCHLATGYMQRFSYYFGWDQWKHKPPREMRAEIRQRARETCRGRMIGGALRAWQTRKLFGIGPGMHQHLWAHFAASPDGDRDLGQWPSLPNYDFHSYEVHSDWVQLLEEYGLAGLTLFLLPTAVVFRILTTRLRRQARLARHAPTAAAAALHAGLLAGVLAFAAMAFHSLGDFNLQMPATTWVLAAVLVIPIACSARVVRVTPDLSS